MANSPELALFGCYVTRWKDTKPKSGEITHSTRWEEHVSFRAPKEVEHTDAAWDSAKVKCGKRWKHTPTSGWEVRELWMEPPSHW